MKISIRLKIILVSFSIILSGIIGGILGNWIFIYFLDTYYDIPNGNYGAVQTSTNIPIRSPEKNTNNSSIAVSVANAEGSLVGIFKRSNFYLPSNKIGQAVIMTSDGWLMSPIQFEAVDKKSLSDYVVVANDKKVYDIDSVIADKLNKISFIRLDKANNLPVKDFVFSRDIVSGQEVVGLEWKGAVTSGLMNYRQLGIRSSEGSLNELSVDGLKSTNIFLFDLSGRMVGFSMGTIVYDIDGIQASLNKIITDSKIRYARLGIHYITLNDLPVESGEGALITAADKKPAIVKGSPAEKAGLLAGDIILTIDRVQINASSDIAAILKQHVPGDNVGISFSRNKEIKNINVTLDELILQ